MASSGNESNKKEKVDSKLARVLNSTMAFMVAYLLIMGLMYTSAAVIAKLFGFDVQVFYYGMKVQLGRQRWTPVNTFWIYACSTFVLAGAGMACLYGYHYFKDRLRLANLVVLWGAVIALSMSAAQGLLPLLAPDDHSPYYTNLAIVFHHWGMPAVVMAVICVVFMLMLVFLAINLARPFLYFSYSYSKVNKRSRRRKYFIETALVPFVLAGGLILGFYAQTYGQSAFLRQNVVYLVVIAAVLVIAFLMANIIDVRADDVLRYKNLQQLNPILFVILIAVLMFLTVTWQGIHVPF